MKYWSQFVYFHSRKCIWKCRLENVSHLVSASMCLMFNAFVWRVLSLSIVLQFLRISITMICRTTQLCFFSSQLKFNKFVMCDMALIERPCTVQYRISRPNYKLLGKLYVNRWFECYLDCGDMNHNTALIFRVQCQTRGPLQNDHELTFQSSYKCISVKDTHP